MPTLLLYLDTIISESTARADERILGDGGFYHSTYSVEAATYPSNSWFGQKMGDFDDKMADLQYKCNWNEKVKRLTAMCTTKYCCCFSTAIGKWWERDAAFPMLAIDTLSHLISLLHVVISKKQTSVPAKQMLPVYYFNTCSKNKPELPSTKKHTDRATRWAPNSWAVNKCRTSDLYY